MSENGKEKTRKLSLVASKGSLDMAYPPLILANAARMSGIEAHIFFTFWGLDLITKSKFRSLKVSTVGNPSLSFAPYAPNMHMPTILGTIPGMTPLATAMMKREIAKLDFPPVDEFIEMLLDAGTHL
jgi:peroxiredoxin family protein